MTGKDRRRALSPRKPRARAGPARSPWGRPELIVASMLLADSVYDAHSRRLKQVLALGAGLLVTAACLITALQPGVDPQDDWLHPRCPIGLTSPNAQPR